LCFSLKRLPPGPDFGHPAATLNTSISECDGLFARLRPEENQHENAERHQAEKQPPRAPSCILQAPCANGQIRNKRTQSKNGDGIGKQVRNQDQRPEDRVNDHIKQDEPPEFAAIRLAAETELIAVNRLYGIHDIIHGYGLPCQFVKF
jgi:hypothetical protein